MIEGVSNLVLLVFACILAFLGLKAAKTIVKVILFLIAAIIIFLVLKDLFWGASINLSNFV